MTQERRATIRHRVLKGGRIVFNDGFSTYDCMVRNFSEDGAKLKVASVIGIPDQFQLVLDDGRKFDCAVSWRTEAELGVTFRRTAE
jgi:hypothetical protein